MKILGCDNMIRSNQGTLISPGYNRISYPIAQQCKYTIELPDSNDSDEQSITLAVNSFDVALDDTLEVKNFV